MDTSPRAAPHPGAPARPRRRWRLAWLALALLLIALGVLLWSSSTRAPEGVGTVAGEVEAGGDHSSGEGPEPAPKTAPPAPGHAEPADAPTGTPDGTSPGASDEAPTAPPAPSETTGPFAYVFPVEPAAAASYGRDHHTYPATDLFAACGTTLVAITDGIVDEAGRTDDWDPGVDDPATRSGRFVSIVGDDGVRYYLSHLASVEPGVTAGARVTAGRPIGSIGRSGNARSTPCHAHLGISPPLGPGDWEVRRGVIWPWPYLDAWREGRPVSPAGEVATWAP
jgi:peptidoglycan LD-endopeptidase LytH